MANQLPGKTVILSIKGGCKGDDCYWSAKFDQGFEGTHTKKNVSEMELSALIVGLSVIELGSHVIVKTRNQNIVSTMTDWIKRWKKNNWQRKSGKPIQNKVLWQEVDKLTANLLITWSLVK